MTAFGLVIAEPDVALTDWALAVEAFVLAWLSRSHGRVWMMFFGSIALAAFLGGVSHGFFPDRGGVLGVLLWRGTLLALGVTSVAAVVGGAGALDARVAAHLRRVAVTLGFAYAGVVLGVSDAFAVAVIAYLPSTAFLLWVFGVAARRPDGRLSRLAVAGIAILLFGSWVQWRALAAPALGLTHNALFHVIQMMALPLIYQGVRDRRAAEGRRC